MIYKDCSEWQIRLLARSNEYGMFVHEGLKGILHKFGCNPCRNTVLCLSSAAGDIKSEEGGSYFWEVRSRPDLER